MKEKKITIIGSDFQHYQQLATWPKEVMRWFMKKCYYWWKSKTIEKKMVLHLTWGQVGTGCQMFSIDSLLTLVKELIMS
jgi:hypothetical protein